MLKLHFIFDQVIEHRAYKKTAADLKLYTFNRWYLKDKHVHEPALQGFACFALFALLAYTAIGTESWRRYCFMSSFKLA